MPINPIFSEDIALVTEEEVVEEEERVTRKAGKWEGEETGEGVAKVDEEAAACSQSPWQTRGQSARGAPSSDSSRQNVEALRRRSKDAGTR